MIKIDDRTPKQRKTHTWAVVARDKFMSGWGQAQNGHSRCGWVVSDEFIHDGRLDRLESWVRSRSEMRNVNTVNMRTYRPPRGTVHFHLYVAGPDHPAFR